MLRWPTAIPLLALAEGWGPPGSPPHSGLLQNNDINTNTHTHQPTDKEKFNHRLHPQFKTRSTI